MFPPVEEQLEVIKNGAEEIISEEELIKKLKKSRANNEPLRIKQGFDPTAPDIHLGHTVGIRKLRDFQELGHTVVLIVGDYTGMVGDPTEKDSTRPRLTHDEVMEHAKTYEEQFFKILDKDKTEIRYNGEWFADMNFIEIMELASRFTVARILERDDFEKRYREGNPISLHEFFYPLMQGYDSVAIKSDVELGATEQKFNLLAARQVQREYGIEPQVALTMPVIEGIDGRSRMSKSTGNYIGIDESPRQMFGKIMSIPDNLIIKYFTLLTDYTVDELEEIKAKFNDNDFNPMELKKDLGEYIVSTYHSKDDAQNARSEFEKVFSKNELPDDINEINLNEEESELRLFKLLSRYNFTSSNGQAKRLMKQGGVKVNDKTIKDLQYTLDKNTETIVKVGKKRFVKFITS